MRSKTSNEPANRYWNEVRVNSNNWDIGTSHGIKKNLVFLADYFYNVTREEIPDD